ncbi:hypothetical protein IOD16_12665 [Saccharothrix sp. 6-C]|nr:hypothetical protein [Saccharothrix sp. 6-C]QQQ79203.1 hypothetical protein IOD16_12665 [Saccharothrix sp. 6-C]
MRAASPARTSDVVAPEHARLSAVTSGTAALTISADVERWHVFVAVRVSP